VIFPDFLAPNLAALGSRFPELADLLARAEEGGLQISAAASGEASARSAAGGWLHSSRDPRGEAHRLATSCLSEGADLVLALGFGLGYGVEACLQAGAQAVIVCEAGPEVLRSAFRARDLQSLVADERVGFVVGGEPEGIISALELSSPSCAALLENRAAVASAPEWFSRARASFDRWRAKEAVNESTLRRFGRLWVRNLARNIGAIAGASGVERLEGLFSAAAPLPAIVLAAGPSLDLVLPRLSEISRRALVVCVDTALRSALRYGLEPDFLVVVDPQYWNWRHIAGLASPSSFLVSESSAWPPIFRTERRGTFLGGSLFPLGKRVEESAGVRGRLGAGGSVATSAWDLCRLMGCSSIWMAGLDLAYPEGRTHARASLFEQRALSSGSRLAPASLAQAAALVGGGGLEATSTEGGKVRTDQRMRLYAWWFESRLARPSSPPTVSLSRGGLAIPGMASGDIEELLALPDRRDEIENRLAAAAALRPPEGSRGRTYRGLDSLRRQLERIALAAEKAQSAARVGVEALASGKDCSDALELLASCDDEILSLEGRDVAGFLLPSARELAVGKAGSLGESFAQSEALYGSLAESARYHLEILELDDANS